MNSNANGNAMVRSVVGIAGVLAAAGIIGAVVMYGQLQGLLVQVSSQEQHIEFLDRRMQQCENVIRRREEAYAKQ